MASLKSLQTINAGGCGTKGTLLHFGGNVNWYNHYGRRYGNSLKNKRIFLKKKKKNKLLYDPAIPFLGIHSEETKIERDTYIPLLIAALYYNS